MISPVAADLFALDISRKAAKITSGKIGKKIVIADGRETPFKSDYFDLIISFEVFEHITGVERYLTEVHRMLKADGLFIMSTPNVETYHLAGMNPYHVREYSVAEVTLLLKEAGFTDQRIFAQITVNKDIARLEKSKLLLSVMKLKRKFGFHGNLLPKPLQRVVHKKISRGDFRSHAGAWERDCDYSFIEGKIEEPELVYMIKK